MRRLFWPSVFCSGGDCPTCHRLPRTRLGQVAVLEGHQHLLALLRQRVEPHAVTAHRAGARRQSADGVPLTCWGRPPSPGPAAPPTACRAARGCLAPRPGPRRRSVPRRWATAHRRLLAEHAKQAGVALRGDREVRAEAAAVDLVGHLPDPVGAAEALAHPDLDVVAGGETGYPDARPVPLVQPFRQVGEQGLGRRRLERLSTESLRMPDLTSEASRSIAEPPSRSSMFAGSMSAASTAAVIVWASSWL